MAQSGVNWSEVAVIVGVAGVLEAPAIVLAGAAWRWVKDVNRRLERIEERSHQRRRGDPPLE